MTPYLWIPLLAILNTLIIELFNHKVFTTGFASMLHFVATNPLALLVNIMLVLLTLVPAFFFKHRVFWCALVSAIWLIAGVVNGFILMNRMTPFTTADLTVFNTGLETLPNYMSTGYIVLMVVLLILLMSFLIYLLVRGPKSHEPFRRRMVAGLAALVLAGAGLSGSWVLAFQMDQLSTSFANLAFAYADYGFPYCFLQTWLNKGVQKPNGYSRKDVQRIRSEIQSDTATTNPQTDVNVVYVQLESFMDPSEIQGLTLSEDAVPVWHSLEKNYTSGYLRVPVVGAGTANTEFEMLTGMSSSLFGPGEYPYKTCLQKNTVESIAYDLSQLGYATHAIHNHRATFYSRNVVYKNLGFDDFTSLEYMPRVARTLRGWSKDYVLTSQISKALDSTANQSDLVFTVSVQGHGSYPTEEILTDPEITVTQYPDHCNQYSIEYYVNQIHEMDEFIGELVSTLSKRDEKTILILYGDHLPSLNLTKDDMKSGSLYKTKYIVWDNFGLTQADRNLYAYQLTAYAMSKIGISQGLMMQFHQFCQDEPTYRTDLKELQYDVLYGKDYLYDGKNPYQPSDMKMGMSDIKITGMYERDGYWYVQGENFSPYCKVSVHEKLLDTSYINTTLLRINEDPGVDSYLDLGVSVVDMHKEVLSDTELD
jgi:phosphoglycerol transferase MdoB-like AlkP superfamily enzyme